MSRNNIDNQYFNATSFQTGATSCQPPEIPLPYGKTGVLSFRINSNAELKNQ
ncbi:hypothetical protein GGR06_004172 [Bacteroides reticulotermitis]|uniref:Uncharacterized protein n=1 Tax=Bacteroides reticulotermitis TaxID=1133319 RepID=A0A840D788_9BACE|nr:hypothetical protein [Bacteroides reticulotermitis]MBB4046338.1 hypothetical protein [Bacteroides reticulotermitis]